MAGKSYDSSWNPLKAFEALTQIVISKDDPDFKDLWIEHYRQMLSGGFSSSDLQELEKPGRDTASSGAIKRQILREVRGLSVRRESVQVDALRGLVFNSLVQKFPGVESQEQQFQNQIRALIRDNQLQADEAGEIRYVSGQD